ncbi:MAG: CHASE domain-containing protein, partial [Candidatus Magnetominusculus sp. LBB02]|nr:CHASE domain-containing protein [Candidatus Magnetominusculus sp. LBB02]
MKNYKMIYLLIALICVGAALAAYHMSVYSLDKESLLKFKSKVDEQAWIIERDITFQFEQISDIASFFTVVDNITSEMFNAYITGEDFQRHVTTFNFGWLPRVPYSQKTEFELAVRKQGVLPDYYIFERSEGKAISVKVRDEYFPYLFRVAVGNSIGRVKGFDFASDPKRRKAIETARDTGKMTASEPIKLINDNSTVIQIYMPVYNGRPKTVEERRTQLRGVAFGSFLPKHILDANLVAREFFDKYAAYYIAVAGLPAEQGLLYRHAYAAALTKYSYTKPIEVSELHLLLTASPLPFFFSERRGWLPGFISLGTFIIFGLTGTIFIKMLLRRAIIENEVEKKTNELRATIEQMSALGRTIQESEKKYRELVELSMDGIWLADKDGATTFVNKSLTDMLGFSVDEMLGVNFLNFMDDDSKALAIKAVEKQVRTGERNQLEINYLHKNGSVVSVLVSASVILDDDGNHTAFFATITNITERKKLERTLAASEQKYRELVELSINGLWAI